MGNIFDQLPAAAPRERVLYFDAIEYLLMAAHLHYRRMQDVARHIAQHVRSDTDAPARGHFAAFVADITALITTVNQLRQIVDRLPRDYATRIMKKAYGNAVGKVEPVRNHLEHLVTSIPRMAPTGHPALGSMGWSYLPEGAEKPHVVGIVPGTLAPAKGLGRARVPSEMRDDVDHVWVTIAGETFDLSDVYWATVNLEDRLRAWSEEQRQNGWPALQVPTRGRVSAGS